MVLAMVPHVRTILVLLPFIACSIPILVAQIKLVAFTLHSTHAIRSHVCWLQSTALSALSMSQFSTILSYEKKTSRNHGWAHMSIMPSLNFAGSRVEQIRAPNGARSAPLNIPCATGHQPNAMPFWGRCQKWRGVIHGDSSRFAMII